MTLSLKESSRKSFVKSKNTSKPALLESSEKANNVRFLIFYLKNISITAYLNDLTAKCFVFEN